MTNSSWNETELQNTFSGCANLRDVITKIEQEYSQRGEVICEIRVNGMLLEESDETEFATNPLSGIHELAIRADRPSDLIRGVLKSAIDFLPGLETSCTKTADLLRGADVLAGRRAFGDVLDGYQWLVDTLVHVRRAALGIGEPLSETDKWINAERSMAQVVGEIVQAHAANDMVLVADLLEYEMTSVMAFWSEILPQALANK